MFGQPLNDGADVNVVHIHPTLNPAKGLQHCLEYIYREAIIFDLVTVAHYIGLAAEAARVASAECEAARAAGGALEETSASHR